MDLDLEGVMDEDGFESVDEVEGGGGSDGGRGKAGELEDGLESVDEVEGGSSGGRRKVEEPEDDLKSVDEIEGGGGSDGGRGKAGELEDDLESVNKVEGGGGGSDGGREKAGHTAGYGGVRRLDVSAMAAMGGQRSGDGRMQAQLWRNQGRGGNGRWRWLVG